MKKNGKNKVNNNTKHRMPLSLIIVSLKIFLWLMPKYENGIITGNQKNKLEYGTSQLTLIIYEIILNIITEHLANLPLKAKYNIGEITAKENKVNKYHIGGLKSAHKREFNISDMLLTLNCSPLTNSFAFINNKPNAENMKYGIINDFMRLRNFLR